MTQAASDLAFGPRRMPFPGFPQEVARFGPGKTSDPSLCPEYEHLPDSGNAFLWFTSPNTFVGSNLMQGLLVMKMHYG
jgi:hypothetical protein